VPETNQAVLFGGSNIGDTLDDLWIYDTIKRDWFYQKPQESSYPAKRNAFAMVYASIPKRVILFGGARTCNCNQIFL